MKTTSDHHLSTCKIHGSRPALFLVARRNFRFKCVRCYYLKFPLSDIAGSQFGLTGYFSPWKLGLQCFKPFQPDRSRNHLCVASTTFSSVLFMVCVLCTHYSLRFRVVNQSRHLSWNLRALLTDHHEGVSCSPVRVDRLDQRTLLLFLINKN
jgi:hypothetical protein